MKDLTQFIDVLEITPSAIEKIADLIESRDKENLAVRVAIAGQLPGGGYQTEFKFVDREELTEEDVVQDTGTFHMYYDEFAASAIQGARVDFDEAKYSSGFNIDYPEPQVIPPDVKQRRDFEEPLALELLNLIETEINPAIAMHGGYVILENFENDDAYVFMGGGCQGCGMSQVTLRQGIEKMIFEKLPGIKNVVDITDHEEGENPYYAETAAVGESPLD